MERPQFAWELRLWLITEAAPRRRVVHHVELAAELAPLLDLDRPTVEELLHNALAAVEDYEAAAGRPLLTSLVVSSLTKAPSDGYYECAKSLGHEVPDDPQGRTRFWEDQCRQVFEHWSAVVTS